MRLLAPILIAAGMLAATAHGADRPNVLFLCVDDWNDWVGCLGEDEVKTPHMDRLAARGILFTNAHCASPVCNPSRAAVMSGLRPFETGVYENGAPLQLALPDGRLTLPQLFRAGGYLSHGAGKIYHDQIGFNFPSDWDHFYLWNELYRTWGWECGYSRAPDPQPEPRPAAKITSKTKRNFDFAPLACPDREMPDFKSTSYGVEFLGREHPQPFFLAVGQFRPHLPWFVPEKYFDLYPIDEIKTPPVLEGDVDDLPEIAKQRALDRNSKHAEIVRLGEWERAVQAYKACISFADAQIGRLLDALDAGPHRDNTIVVLWSDHGYHLGEKGHWHKRTLWERSTHVPLIFVVPGVTRAGSTCDNPVDLTSIYPTLAELAGLPGASKRSLVPMLEEPGRRVDSVALTSHTRGNHAVRSHTHRYIRYSDGSEELYDHRADPNEWHNLAGDGGSEKVIASLREHLPESEAPAAPDYYRGTALIKLDGEGYTWGRKSEIAGDPAYVNAARLKSKAWQAAAKEHEN